MDAVLDDRPGFGIQEGRPILQLAGTREENWWRRRESNPATSVVLAPYRGGIAQKCPICRNRSAAGASYLARRTTIPLAAWTNGTMALPCGAGDQANLLATNLFSTRALQRTSNARSDRRLRGGAAAQHDADANAQSSDTGYDGEVGCRIRGSGDTIRNSRCQPCEKDPHTRFDEIRGHHTQLTMPSPQSPSRWHELRMVSPD